MKKFIGYQKGINLGGWFSQCDYSKENYDGFITENDFKELSTWNIDHIRLPIDYNLLEDENGNYLNSGMEYLEKVVDWCGKYNLNMVLDLHKTFGYSFDPGESENGFFNDTQLQERFYKLWEYLASKFGKYSNRIAFEILNEVTDKEYCTIWNNISKECVSRIRKFAPDTYILIGGYWNNSIEAIPNLPLPYDDKIVYNFHCYEPLVFTHQGAYWVNNMPSDFRLSYPSTTEHYQRLEKEFSLPIESVLSKATTKTVATEFFEWQFSKAVEIAEERNVSLYCGEYGVINLADLNSTLEWYKNINSAFEKFGIGRCAWCYKSLDFGLTDEHTKPILKDLKKYL